MTLLVKSTIIMFNCTVTQTSESRAAFSASIEATICHFFPFGLQSVDKNVTG